MFKSKYSKTLAILAGIALILGSQSWLFLSVGSASADNSICQITWDSPTLSGGRGLRNPGDLDNVVIDLRNFSPGETVLIKNTNLNGTNVRSAPVTVDENGNFYIYDHTLIRSEEYNNGEYRTDIVDGNWNILATCNHGFIIGSVSDTFTTTTTTFSPTTTTTTTTLPPTTTTTLSPTLLSPVCRLTWDSPKTADGRGLRRVGGFSNVVIDLRSFSPNSTVLIRNTNLDDSNVRTAPVGINSSGRFYIFDHTPIRSDEYTVGEYRTDILSENWELLTTCNHSFVILENTSTTTTTTTTTFPPTTTTTLPPTTTTTIFSPTTTTTTFTPTTTTTLPSTTTTTTTISPTTTTTTTLPPVSLVNNSTCVSINSPNTVVAGQNFSASVVMINSGTKAWTGGDTPHKLGSENPQDNYTWGRNRVYMPVSRVRQGGTVSFDFNVTAPQTVGSYNFNWKMLEEGIEWFGETCHKTISVESGLTPTPTPTLTITPTPTPTPNDYNPSVDFQTYEVRNLSRGQSGFGSNIFVSSGDEIEFRLVARNYSSATARDARVNVYLPYFLSLMDNSLTVNGSYNYYANLYDGFYLGQLSGGEQKEIRFRARASDSFSDYFQIFASITGSNFSTVNRSVSFQSGGTYYTPYPTPTVSYQYPFLSVSKLGKDISRGDSAWLKTVQALPNDILQFSIMLTSSGNETVRNVYVKDQLDGLIAFLPGSVTINDSPTSDALVNSELYLGDLSPGQVKFVKLQARVVSSDSFSKTQTLLTNTARVRSSNYSNISDGSSVNVTNQYVTLTPNYGTPAPSPSTTPRIVTQIIYVNNSGQTADVVKLGRNISQEQKVPTKQLSAKPNDELEFTIQVTSTSGQTIKKVLIKDVLPPEIDYIFNSTRLGNQAISDDIVRQGFAIANLRPQETRIITYHVRVLPEGTFSGGKTELKNSAAIVIGNSTVASDSAMIVVQKGGASLLGGLIGSVGFNGFLLMLLIVAVILLATFLWQEKRKNQPVKLAPAPLVYRSTT